jgi:hypothetical protein
MAGYLQLAQAARAANARIRSARELETRWNALGPEGQAEAREEWDRLTAALVAARARVAAGPRGFVREFSAAYKGVETEATPDPRSIGTLLGELHAATNALRDKLDAAEATQSAAPVAPAPAATPAAAADPAPTATPPAAPTHTVATPDPGTPSSSEHAGGPSPYEQAEAAAADAPSPYEQAEDAAARSPYEQAERASAAPTPEDPAHR